MGAVRPLLPSGKWATHGTTCGASYLRDHTSRDAHPVWSPYIAKRYVCWTRWRGWGIVGAVLWHPLSPSLFELWRTRRRPSKGWERGPIYVSAKRTQFSSREKHGPSIAFTIGYALRKRPQYLGSFWKTNPI